MGNEKKKNKENYEYDPSTERKLVEQGSKNTIIGTTMGKFQYIFKLKIILSELPVMRMI